MIRPRRLGTSTRFVLVAFLALCLGVRLLTPAGFMPSFADGTLAIIQCPDADGALPSAAPVMRMAGMPMPGMAMPASDDHRHDGIHQLCPYAQAASLAGIDPGIAMLAILRPRPVLPPLAAPMPIIRRHPTRDRPPAQGPPLLA